jgi:D-sedoheptulose 7-phosphate isomerase
LDDPQDGQQHRDNLNPPCVGGLNGEPSAEKDRRPKELDTAQPIARRCIMTLEAYLADSAGIIGATGDAIAQDQVDAAIDTIVAALSQGKPLLICGNGGSAADAMHITGELVGRFMHDRKALKAYCLSSNPSVLTAWSNDASFETVFARQVEAYGEEGAVLIGISTSGASTNVIAAFAQARALKMRTVALTGENSVRLAPLADHLLAVPSRYTPLIQQAHLCLYHYLCMRIEQRMMEV